MSLLSQISGDVVVALKKRESLRVSTLRMLVSALKYAAIDAKFMTDEDEQRVLIGEAKKRREAILAYEKVSPERAAQEQSELAIIESYLPAEIPDAQIVGVITTVIKDNPGLAAGPLMGKVMGMIKAKGWLVDGSRIKGLVDATLIG